MSGKGIELRVTAPGSVTNKNPYKLNVKNADMVIVYCTTGELGILPGRVPLSAVLADGIIRYFCDGTEKKAAVMGGLVQVDSDIVTILTEDVITPEEVNREKVHEKLSDLNLKIAGETKQSEKDKLAHEVKKCKVLLHLAG